MIKDIIDDIMTNLGNNAIIRAYCQEKFEKNLTVIVGAVAEKPAAQGQMPALIIGMPEMEITNDTRKYSIPVALGIVNENIYSDYYQGALQVAELAEIIAEEIILLNYNVRVKVEKIPTSELFPVFYSFSSVLIEKKKPLRPRRA